MNNQNDYIEAAQQIIVSLGLPRAQQNERSALCLLALLNLTPGKAWADAENPLVGITPIMDWAREHYGKEYAPNTRETFRRQSMHQFCDAGVALYNPDKPDRPVNSPKAVYQIEPAALAFAAGVIVGPVLVAKIGESFDTFLDERSGVMDASKNISAFPVFDSNRAGMDYECMEPGMTLRDYFAIESLPAIYKDFWESVYAQRHGSDENWRDGIAKEAYLLADAMLRARGE